MRSKFAARLRRDVLRRNVVIKREGFTITNKYLSHVRNNFKKAGRNPNELNAWRLWKYCNKYYVDIEYKGNYYTVKGKDSLEAYHFLLALIDTIDKHGKWYPIPKRNTYKTGELFAVGNFTIDV